MMNDDISSLLIFICKIVFVCRERANQLFDALDADGSGSITLYEFVDGKKHGGTWSSIVFAHKLLWNRLHAHTHFQPVPQQFMQRRQCILLQVPPW